MKVSIITAVRNGADVVSRTINSVATQNYPEIEHVIVDGASTDCTVEVVSALATQNVRMISERDSGVYDAFNKGLKLATGDIIGFLNAGDVYSSTTIVSLIAREFLRPSVNSVFGDVVVVDQLDINRVLRRYRSSRFSPAAIAYGFMPAHPTLYMRRSVYEANGNFDTSYRIAGDFELVARLFYRRNISYSYIPEVLVRMPRGGLSTSGPRSNWIITKEMKRACDANGIPTSLFRLALRFPIKLTEWIRPNT